MTLTYFKRFRMEIRLEQVALDKLPELEGILFFPWSSALLNKHAGVKLDSFRDEIDSHIFPCLAEKEGCRSLMREIANRSNFAPAATWLAVRRSEFDQEVQPCGTVQGLLSSPREGAIQNLGVHPDFRGMGIGRALIIHALRGFRDAGCMFANLEVTVQNTAAIRLYERFGFRRVETLFKVAEVQYA
jgi:ribosomal protein S18 acetylase RimI-like enzyme